MEKNDNEGEEIQSDPLERQLVRGSFFLHSEMSKQARRLNETESFLFGLIDTLLETGLIEEDALKEKVKLTREEIITKAEQFKTGVAIRKDVPKAKPQPKVNCKERMHVCNAVCCKLYFALSLDDLEKRKVKWDLGRPYFIRQEEDGYCTHINRESKQCCVYNDRPNPCSIYSCIGDKRIWKDFEKMELNHEWIEAKLGERNMTFQPVYMNPETSS